MSKKEFRCSASTVNLFLKDPCLFVLKHYYGMRTEFNVYAMRGVAIEHGVDRFFETGDMKQAIMDALDKFYDLTFDLDHEFEEIEKLIPGWTESAIALVVEQSNGRTPHMQTELTFKINDLPFIGFLDYEFEDEVIDLKTANKVPHILVRGERKGKLPAAKADNIRQQCIYRFATGKSCKLLYVSPEESLTYEIQDDEYEEYMSEVEGVVEEIKKILTNGEEYAINKYTPNSKLFGSFYYNDEMINKVQELWHD